VFFEHLGLEWEYEPQGYVVNNRPYLPDFRLLLPGDDIRFAEVKPAETDPLEGEHVDLCRALARDTGSPVILLTGPPAWRPYNQFMPELPSNELAAVFFRDYEPKIEALDAYWWQGVTANHHGQLEFPHDQRAAGKSFGRGLVAAVSAALSARFEYEAGDRP
jgi:hypothetical protein